MKKYSWFLLLAFVAFACQLQNEEITLSDDASGHHTSGVYGINTSSSSDGKTWTFVIDQTGQHGISHMNFKFADCDGNALNTSNITSATVNGNDWMGNKIVQGVPPADACYAFGGDVIKLDAFDFSGVVTIVITFDTALSGGAFVIKAGNNCYGLNDPNYSFSRDCTPPEPCYDYQNETAWADGTRYVTRGNWATWTPYQSTSSVVLYAGKNMEAGSVSMSEVSNGEVTITITLGAGWSFQDVGEPVKIQGYNSRPPASNPSPGRFANKGSSLVVTVPAANYYGIHLDVRKQIEVECPTN